MVGLAAWLLGCEGEDIAPHRGPDRPAVSEPDDPRWPGRTVVVEDGDNSLCCCAINGPNCNNFLTGGTGYCSDGGIEPGRPILRCHSGGIADAAPIDWALQQDEYGCPLWVLVGPGANCNAPREDVWEAPLPDASAEQDVPVDVDALDDTLEGSSEPRSSPSP